MPEHPVPQSTVANFFAVAYVEFGFGKPEAAGPDPADVGEADFEVDVDQQIVGISQQQQTRTVSGLVARQLRNVGKTALIFIWGNLNGECQLPIFQICVYNLSHVTVSTIILGGVLVKSIPFSLWQIVTCAIVLASLDPLPAAGFDEDWLPQSPCPIGSSPNWTKTESWAWEQLCASKIADFNKLLGEDLNVKSQERQLDQRLLKSSFIETILLNPPYRNVLPRRGLRLIGAVIAGELDLNNADISAEIKIEKSKLLEGIRLDGATFHLGIAFNECYITGKIIANNLRGKPYFAIEKSFIAEMDMSGSRIDGSLFANNAVFYSNLTANGAKITDALFAEDAKFWDAVSFNGARIGESLVAPRSLFLGEVILDNIEAGQSIVLNNATFFLNLQILGGHIGGDIILTESVFLASIRLKGTRVDNSVFLDHTIIDNIYIENMKNKTFVYDYFTNKENQGVYFDNVMVKRDLNVYGTTFGSSFHFPETYIGESFIAVNAKFINNAILNARSSTIGNTVFLQGAELQDAVFTETHISNGLVLSDNNENVAIWGKESVLDLRNVQVNWLQDNEHSWPNHIRVIGLHYNYWMGGGGSSSDGYGKTDWVFETRRMDWFEEWLAKEKNYSPQPYEALSQIFMKSGYKEKARYILYIGRERERKSIAEREEFIYKSILNIFIGHGYILERLIKYWLFFVVVGTTVGWKRSELSRNHTSALEYSLDTLLPIIVLRRRHEVVDFTGWRRYYFYIHKCMGWVLALFLVAGLTGLTK